MTHIHSLPNKDQSTCMQFRVLCPLEQNNTYDYYYYYYFPDLKTCLTFHLSCCKTADLWVSVYVCAFAGNLWRSVRLWRWEVIPSSVAWLCLFPSCSSTDGNGWISSIRDDSGDRLDTRSSAERRTRVEVSYCRVFLKSRTSTHVEKSWGESTNVWILVFWAFYLAGHLKTWL